MVLSIHRLSALLITVFLCGCAAGVPMSSNGAPDLDAGIADLGDRIMSSAGMAKVSRIAVLPFSELQSGSVDPFGKYLSEGLVSRLARNGEYAVIERELLNKVLEEHRLGMLGMLDEVSAKKVGSILGADAIISGTYSVLDSRVKVNARVISSASGLIIATDDASLVRSREVDQLLALRQPAPPARTPVPSGTDPAVVPPPGGFVPVNFALPVSHQGCSIPFSGRKPAAIKREPAYEGSVRRYGSLTLGTRSNNTFLFALDITPGKFGALYLDRNQNGDLTDDGPPVLNQGSSDYFSAALALPFNRVLENAVYKEYDAWLYVNETSWHQNQMCHYTRTQFKGAAWINDRAYLAYLADFGVHDGDYTNDGLYLDLDQDQRIDTRKERIPPGNGAILDGKVYYFKVLAENGSFRVQVLQGAKQ